MRTLLYVFVLIAAWYFMSRWAEVRRSIINRRKKLEKQGYSYREAKRMAREEFLNKN
ncbi:MAG: hypothetical protein ABI390_02530 [Daejeonella sp.]